MPSAIRWAAMENGGRLTPRGVGSPSVPRLREWPVDEHAAEEFEPSARTSGIHAKIDEARIAELCGWWSVHIQ